MSGVGWAQLGSAGLTFPLISDSGTQREKAAASWVIQFSGQKTEQGDREAEMKQTIIFKASPYSSQMPWPLTSIGQNMSMTKQMSMTPYTCSSHRMNRNFHVMVVDSI